MMKQSTAQSFEPSELKSPMAQRPFHYNDSFIEVDVIGVYDSPSIVHNRFILFKDFELWF